jgi:hypothetical protein
MKQFNNGINIYAELEEIDDLITADFESGVYSWAMIAHEDV